MSSLRGQSFADILTHTRASAANYCNASGVLTSAGVDVPRIDYDPITHACRGLLFEGARTNYLLRSQEFDNASWAKTRASISANTWAGPDGTLTADKLVEDTTANDSHYCAQNYTKGSTTESQPYAASVWVKAAGRTEFRMHCQGNSGTAHSVIAVFDLSDGTVTSLAQAGNYDSARARIEAWPEGWYRCIIDFRVNNDGQTVVQFVAMLVSNGAATYTGDGTSGVYLWGAQLEKGFYATSYIATTTASATRSVDVCAAASLTPWFNEPQGTIYCEYMVPWTPTAADNVASPRIVQIDDGSESARLLMYMNSGNRRINVYAAGMSQADFSRGAFTPGAVSKHAFAWKEDDVAAVADGQAVSTDSLATMPTGLETFRLGNSSSVNGSPFAGWIRKVRYYPRRLTNTELAALVA